jgi:hypothetical protein
MHTPDFHAVLRRGDGPIPDEVLVHARRLLNGAVRGDLELQYETRTVRLTDIDGDLALRILKAASEHDPKDPTSRRWAEDCDPRSANALDGWVQFRPERLLGSRWVPEHFVPGEADERRLVYAAYRLVRDDLDVAVAETWSSRVWRDYIAVHRDLFGDEATDANAAAAGVSLDKDSDMPSHAPDHADNDATEDQTEADDETTGGDDEPEVTL